MIDSGRKARECEVGFGKNVSTWCDDWVVKLRVAKVSGMRCRAKSLNVVDSSGCSGRASAQTNTGSGASAVKSEDETSKLLACPMRPVKSESASE